MSDPWDVIDGVLEDASNSEDCPRELAREARAMLASLRADHAAAHERGAADMQQRAAKLCDDSEASWAEAWKLEVDLRYSARRSEAHALAKLIRLLSTAPPARAS